MKKKRTTVGVLLILAFSIFMMLNISVESNKHSAMIDSECLTSTNLHVNFGILNAAAQGSDPEECDDSQGECPRTCSGGCSGCFQSTCDDNEDNYYCGAISPIGSEDVIYCWRPEF